jgi:Family of unknown function (DUF5677)
MIRDAPPAVERVEVDLDKIAAFETEEEFTSLAVSLMVEVASYSCVAAATLGASRSWDRDRAAVGGNMVRLYKLLDSFLDQTCKRRGEITWILGRLIFETAVNIRYLIANFSKELIDSYVKQALRQERRLLDVVQANISERGSMLPIEDRMLKSIDRAARAAGVSLEDVDPTDGRPWGGKNIYEKTNEVGLRDAYVAAFGGGSQSVHGNWNEVCSSQVRPGLPGVPAPLKLRLSFFQGRHAIGARHRTISVHGPEPAQTVGTAAGLINAPDRTARDLG